MPPDNNTEDKEPLVMYRVMQNSDENRRKLGGEVAGWGISTCQPMTGPVRGDIKADATKASSSIFSTETEKKKKKGSTT